MMTVSVTIVLGQCFIICPFVIAALSISFDQLSYNVTEGSPVSVCTVIMDGTSAVPVALSIDTSEGTANGKKICFVMIR